MADVASNLEYLRRVPIFSGLPAKELEFISRSVKERAYDAGAVIVKQGDPGVGFFLIVEGRVEVTRDGQPIRDMGPGEFFGEMALLNDKPRNADVVSAGYTNMLVLKRRDFDSLLKAHPGMREKIEEIAHKREAENTRPLTLAGK